jgi:hypothetical protein
VSRENEKGPVASGLIPAEPVVVEASRQRFRVQFLEFGVSCLIADLAFLATANSTQTANRRQMTDTMHNSHTHDPRQLYASTRRVVIIILPLLDLLVRSHESHSTSNCS